MREPSSPKRKQKSKHRELKHMEIGHDQDHFHDNSSDIVAVAAKRPCLFQILTHFSYVPKHTKSVNCFENRAAAAPRWQYSFSNFFFVNMRI